jgi:hypothetical protein
MEDQNNRIRILEEKLNKLEKKESEEDYFTLDNFITMQKGLLFFFLIISGNFLGELLSCRTQKLFKRKMVVKHLIGLISLYFFVIISDNKLSKYNPIVTFIGALVLYLYFLCLAKVESNYFLITLLLFTIIAFTKVYKEYVNNKTKKLTKFELFLKDKISLIQKILILITFIVTTIGFLIYLGMKKIEYNKTFSYLTFFMGKPECSNNLLGKLNTKQLSSVNKNSFVNHIPNLSNFIYFIKTAFY